MAVFLKITIFNIYMMIRYSFFLAILLSLPNIHALCQEALGPKPSPCAVVSVKYKDAYLKITYSQPHKRGREIFGKVVPYGDVWRTGANEATELTTTRDILVNETLLRAGTYSLFTIPEKDSWTIIINSEVGLWGAYNYNAKLDVMRIQRPVQRITNVIYEPFTIQLNQNNELAELLMLWDDVRVDVPLKFTN
jgi:hypothetical protein